MSSLTIDDFNALSSAEAEKIIFNACHSSSVASQVEKLRPYKTIDKILDDVDVFWFALDKDETLGAFLHHPKIGDLDALKKKYAAVASNAASEQALVSQADEDTLRDLQKYNGLYEERHKFRFLVYATGKSALQMLNILKDRLPNSTNVEYHQAVVEQAKITRLRLSQVLKE